jgi:hypothetical protein
MKSGKRQRGYLGFVRKRLPRTAGDTPHRLSVSQSTSRAFSTSSSHPRPPRSCRALRSANLSFYLKVPTWPSHVTWFLRLSEENLRPGVTRSWVARLGTCYSFAPCCRSRSAMETSGTDHGAMAGGRRVRLLLSPVLSQQIGDGGVTDEVTVAAGDERRAEEPWLSPQTRLATGGASMSRRKSRSRCVRYVDRGL